jgi:ribose/xylose/arabinose/galactoside ABC-type transport system permease subunit
LSGSASGRSPSQGFAGLGGRWRALLRAQESGLVLVIAAMMFGLTLRAESFERTDIVRLAGGASVVQSEGEVRVSSGGSTTLYRRSAGYALDDSSSPPVLRHAYRVNRFLNASNLVGVAKDASFIAIMAVGMAGIIILGGIDLSVGSIYALAAILGAMALQRLAGSSEKLVPGWQSIPVGLAVCCGAGSLCGTLNGMASVGFRVHPFIITLGGMAVYRGLAFVITEGQSITGFPASYTVGGFKAEMLGVNPVPMVLMLAVALAGAFVLARTVFGRRTYAIGGNETAARYAGVPVARVKVLWYLIAGALTGLAAAVMLGYLGAASSDAGSGYELRVIAAAVVGGASLSGGRGSALGAMLGALVIQLIENGIVVLRIDSNYTNIVIGLSIIIAVIVDQAKHRLSGGAAR